MHNVRPRHMHKGRKKNYIHEEERAPVRGESECVNCVGCVSVILMCFVKSVFIPSKHTNICIAYVQHEIQSTTYQAGLSMPFHLYTHDAKIIMYTMSIFFLSYFIQTYAHTCMCAHLHIIHFKSASIDTHNFA